MNIYTMLNTKPSVLCMKKKIQENLAKESLSLK